MIKRCRFLRKGETMKTHLTIEERNTILTGVRQGCDKTTIAEMVGKDKSTISLEIKKHLK